MTRATRRWAWGMVVAATLGFYACGGASTTTGADASSTADAGATADATPSTAEVVCESTSEVEVPMGERCLAESDLAIMEELEFEDFEGKLAKCAFGCFMVKECTTNCVAQVLYFTCPCATCFADMMVCISVLCFDPCPGEGCHACMAENGCYDEFDECSGVDSARHIDRD